MSQATSRLRSIAETHVHEAFTLVGFFLCYSAFMSVVVSSTTPFFSNSWASFSWASFWPPALAAAVVATLMAAGLTLAWPKAIRSSL